MITNMTIKDIATYNQTGVTISDLTKLNYFFGNNGCGKSTVAGYLQTLSEGDLFQKYSSCESGGYDPNQEEIIVFNQSFIDNNFRKNDTLKGVFSLNQTNAEIDEKIKKNEQFITEKTNIQTELETDNSVLSKERTDLRNNLSNNCFMKRDIFKSFSKIKLEYSGNKKSNLANIENLLSQGKIVQPSLEDLSNLYKKLYEEDLEEIDVSIDEQLFKKTIEFQNRITPLLEEIIVGKNDVKIAEMIKSYNLRSWVSQGKSYLEQIGKICPFCQQKIPEDFISQLNDMFDESSKEKIKKIEDEKKEYEIFFSLLLTNLQNVSQKYNTENIVSDMQITLKELFDENIQIIDEKIKNSNEKKELRIINESFITKITEVNSAIKQNNDIINSFEEQKKSLQSNIWNYIAADCKSDIDIYKAADKVKEAKVTSNLQEYERLEKEIAELKHENEELRTQTVNTKEAIDSINQILKNSGFMGFEILEKEKVNNISQYYLSRSGTIPEENIFNSLSEGERNFISFLYFYQLCLGTTDILANSSKKKIIVIDDPVSSMDSQVLFIVSTLVQRLIAWKVNNRNDFDNPSIAQVFIFTHNLYFYKEISLKCRPICKLKNHYRIFKNEENISIIESKGKEYEAIDDYSLMWNTLKEIKSQIQEDNKSQNILIANLFRRILESYANFIGMGHDSWATVLTDDKTSIEYYLKCAFISMINDESHKITPFDSFYFQKIHNETPGKLFDVFESIFNTINREHYEKMMKE